MTAKEKGSLLIWCGALFDIAEKSKEFNTSIQVEEVRLCIENLCGEVSQFQSLFTIMSKPERYDFIIKSITP